MKDDLTSAMWHMLVCISQGASGIDVRGGISTTTRALERRGLIHAPGRWLRFELTERGKDLIGGAGQPTLPASAPQVSSMCPDDPPDHA